MNLSQIVNSKNDPVNSSISQMIYEETQVHNAMQGAGNGTLIDVDGKSAVILYVTGDFNAEIVITGSVDGSTFPSPYRHIPMMAYDFYEEKYVKFITKAGVYLVENIGYSKLRVRIDAYKSGEVSVLARVFATPIMNFAQIVNSKNNPVNSSISQMIYEETQVHNAMQGAGNGTLIDVDGKSAVILYVTGDFNAEIVITGSVDGSTFPSPYRHIPMMAYDFYEEKYVKFITKAGVYLVENIGYSKLRVRIDAYKSGEVSVLARVFATPIEWGQIRGKAKAKNRLERVLAITGKTITAGSKVTLPDIIDASDFVYFFVVSRSNAAHPRIIYFLYEFSDITLGSTYGDINVIDDSLIRQKSERIEPLSEVMKVGIHNKDTVDHIYDVFVYGVR